ncbi:MAG: Fic family protein [Bacilli bacterium]|nr:Fic family protein [Bacilli bacterium]
MTFEEEKRIAQTQVEKLIDAGAPIATLSIFDVLDQYTPSERVKGEIEYTKDLYLEYVNKLREFSEEDQATFLKTLKDSDIIDNQSIEKEDSFLIALSRHFEDEVSIDLLLEKIKNGDPITKEEFIYMHDVLLQGTSSQNKQGIREDDLKFVGSYYYGEPRTKYFFENREICYFPLRHTEIDTAMDKFLGFINSGVRPNDGYDVMILPMICHGLLAALQLFQDGNTRYGRLFQSAMLYQFANDSLFLDLPLPVVYGSRQYAAYRDDYRQKVTNLVIRNRSDAWDDWLLFNLRRIQDSIFYNMSCLDKMAQYPRGGRGY